MKIRMVTPSQKRLEIWRVVVEAKQREALRKSENNQK
jgi:hypothetical protein